MTNSLSLHPGTIETSILFSPSLHFFMPVLQFAHITHVTTWVVK